MHLSREGDRDAFAKFFQARRDILVRETERKLGRQLRRRVDASDVMQDVFINANRRLQEIVGTDVPLMAWIRVLLNQQIVTIFRTHLKASKRAMSREQTGAPDSHSLDEIAAKLVAALTSPSMQAHRHDLQHQVRQILEELAPLDREVLILRHFQSKSNAEVAAELGLSINAASNRYVRALKRFKAILDKGSF